MGEHREALEIYVFKMKDFAKAEEYVTLSNRKTTVRLTKKKVLQPPVQGARKHNIAFE